MRRIFLLMFFLSFGLLYADAINSFTADKTSAQPGDLVNLTIDYTASKKYELHFTAYNNSNNAELSPVFGSSGLKNITYTIPNDANYDVKIVAELVEDGNVVDSKQVIISAHNGVSSQYECPSWATYYNHKCWAWASPCSGGCSTITFSRVASGWRFVKDANEWSLRPNWAISCASSHFDNRYTHCDLGDYNAGYLTWKYNNYSWELWVVCDHDCI